MAKDTKETDQIEEPTPQPSMSDLATIIGDGIAKGMAQVAPKKVTAGRYDPKSSFHPDKKLVPQLKRRCFQNGVEMKADLLFDEEIRLLNRIARGGRYLDRNVEVVLRD